jgi:2-methylcitrate dehydratase PrpD
VLQRRVDYPRGAPQNPLSPDELHAKFRDCARRVLSAAETERALRLLRALEEQPGLREVVASLIPGEAA